MPDPVAFGRRPAAPASAKPTRPKADAMELGPHAEAFKAQVYDRPEAKSDPQFKEWLRERQSARIFAWALTFALLSPGILCFVFNAPPSISSALELVGVITNFWLRRQRRRHLKEITEWNGETSG